MASEVHSLLLLRGSHDLEQSTFLSPEAFVARDLLQGHGLYSPKHLSLLQDLSSPVRHRLSLTLRVPCPLDEGAMTEALVFFLQSAPPRTTVEGLVRTCKPGTFDSGRCLNIRASALGIEAVEAKGRVAETDIQGYLAFGGAALEKERAIELVASMVSKVKQLFVSFSHPSQPQLPYSSKFKGSIIA